MKAEAERISSLYHSFFPMTPRLLLIVAACLLSVLAVSHADDRRDSAGLQAIATTDSTEIHTDEVFEVTLSLQNLTNGVRTIKISGSNWDRNWKSSDHRVGWDAWDSDDNEAMTVEIPPHDTYVFPKTLRVYVNEGVKPGRINFRMGFRTATFGKTVWSSPIGIDVIP